MMPPAASSFPSYNPPPGAVDRPTTAPGVPAVIAALGARFWARVRLAGDPASPATCWIHEGQPSRDADGKAPVFTIRSDRMIPVARVAWELTGHGSTHGVALAPVCGNPACCRPRHMVRRPYARETRYGRSVADIAAGHDAAARTHERFDEPPYYRRDPSALDPGSPFAPVTGSRPTSSSSPEPAVPSQPTASPDPTASDAPSPVHLVRGVPAVPLTGDEALRGTRLMRALFGALLTTARVSVSRAGVGLTYVHTPWGTFEDEDPLTAMLHALAEAPADVLARSERAA